MKKIIITFLLPLCTLVALAQTKKAVPSKKTTTVKKATTAGKTTAPTFKSTLDSASYSFGIGMGSSMKSEGLITLNYELLIKGFQDALNGRKTLLTEEQSRQASNNLFKSISAKKNAPIIAEGKAFLENNKKQTGVQITPSGLQYQVLTRGTGVKPAATDTVLVHYKGTLLNGKEFDSSYSRNEPLALPLNGVIKGWTEGVQLMQTGSKYKFFIPYDLAYGERAMGQDIPAYSTLIFEIELLKVTPPKQ
ncbi:FKBP-type peptidyl-prolyl cis-trans isomerase [Pedobacter frigoris]|uniref:Peptidyl-prolyl cis-trans isomerase n=1 Tax=Pedobacter frigoris TaxID=2571272 RepID=A0A4U1CPH6_9SPHI|nr:FKBP-type peptidyl-prolyl cis-trans isomerase [Pedobacter frigoris]TKC07324.1 FKBP-type peptidyl-prolyl cis-trans isomerase [Pedobacter frigoris]